jgi:tetratricopeptide (TPR) repeat protein
LWDVEKSALVGEPMDHKKDLTRALFNPSGKHVLTVEAEGGMRLWDALDAKPAGPTWGHRKPVHHLSFSADGQRVVTASEDGTARVWEADSGQEIAESPGHGAAVLQAAFSPDGKRFVTIDAEHRVRTWDATSGKPISPPLKHRAAVTRAAFSADGKRLVTFVTDGQRIWDATTGTALSPLLRTQADPSFQDFRPDERPPVDLLHIAEVLAGQQLTEGGREAPVDGAELGKLWQELRKKYGKDFSPSAERALAWARRGAVECENQQQWNGALRHLNRLLAAEASAELYASRGRANAQLRHWQAAKADYTSALASERERWDLWAGRAEAESALGRSAEASADYSQAIQRAGDRAELWAARGQLAAQSKEWSKAASDLAKAIQLGSSDVKAWRQHALALLAGGDDANYRRWCGRMLQRFAKSQEPAVLAGVVWTCALREGTVRDLTPLLQVYEQSVTANPQARADRSGLALLRFRTGQFEKTLALLQDRPRQAGAPLDARSCLLMALALQRLHRTDAAKEWLAQAEQLHREQAKDHKPSWEDDLTYETLHREAEALSNRGKP